jgi:hypothetical protein
MRHCATFFIFLTYKVENVWWFQGKYLFLQQFPKTGRNEDQPYVAVTVPYCRLDGGGITCSGTDVAL